MADVEHPMSCKRTMVQFKIDPSNPNSRYKSECFELPTRYVIDPCMEGLGSGTYGAVVQATDTRTGEKVAIKKFIQLFDDSQPVRTRSTLRELKLLKHFSDVSKAQALAQAQALPPGEEAPEEAEEPDNMNICPCREVLVSLGDPSDNINYRHARLMFQDVYVVLKQYTMSLRELMDSGTLLPRVNRSWFMYQLLRGLKALFNADCLHRDLKPDNCLINTDTLELVICDFGSARGYQTDHDGPTVTHMLETTTQWYRPPESFLEVASSYDSSESPGSRFEVGANARSVDIWSCGVILAEMMRGGEPLLPGKPKQPLDQLNWIFTTIAPITDEVMDGLGWMSQQAKEKLFDLGRAGKRASVRRLFENHEDPNEEGVQYAEDEIDLVERMLKILPSQRIDIDDALQHPSFNVDEYDWRTQLEPPPVSVFPFRIEHVQDVREEIWSMYLESRPEVKTFFEELDAQAQA
eukprot:TRINITY_DN19053_c0_g1_i1.p1 TRINITY_DN19053_c0_g1~~TRINITY_DN19053_c0_g1_i1.p1  ORF type:complete len:492 (+),score=144.19 TRINITY_DN19053_c0_g1_i1:83-1477(+)